MILLDTNILVYARNAVSPFHKKAKEIRDDAVDGKLSAALALQSLSEYLAIITSPKRVEKPLDLSEAVDDVRHYLESVRLKKLSLTENTTFHLTVLAKRHSVAAQNIFDAQIVAVMLENKIAEIWTADEKDFAIFDSISVFNPFRNN